MKQKMTRACGSSEMVAWRLFGVLGALVGKVVIVTDDEDRRAGTCYNPIMSLCT